MLDEDENRGSPIIRNLGALDDDQVRMRQIWATFDAWKCKCFKQEDKEILKFIKATMFNHNSNLVESAYKNSVP